MEIGFMTKKRDIEKHQKNKRDRLEIEGRVIDAFPSGMFSIEVDGTENTIVLATLSGKMRENFIRVVVGDWVRVEVSPYDMKRGRILTRVKSADRAQK